MQQKVKNQFLFRMILLIIVLVGIEAIGYFGMWVNSRSFDFLSNRNYFQIRAMLRGDTSPEHLPKYLSVPYLGYIPHPGYKKAGVIQHNEDGYRGEKVPVQKNNKLRVLCMGGSTTYGYAVDSPEQTFPARLKVLLNEYLLSDSFLSKKYAGAEVINAGLEAGNSAEEVQQYLFKYRYYKPDIVIIHSGVNDALIAGGAVSNFQLDYTDSKRLYFNLEPLSFPVRWLMKSYFISYLTIRLYYNNFARNESNGGHCFARPINQEYCAWSHINIDSVIAKKQYEFYPFYRNSKSLFESVERDSSILMVFPNALNRTSDFIKINKKYADITSINASLSQSLCKECNGVFVPFDFDSIKDPSCWVDDCHVNAKGEERKAEILFRAVIYKLNQLKTKYGN